MIGTFGIRQPVEALRPRSYPYIERPTRTSTGGEPRSSSTALPSGRVAPTQRTPSACVMYSESGRRPNSPVPNVPTRPSSLGRNLPMVRYSSGGSTAPTVATKHACRSSMYRTVTRQNPHDPNRVNSPESLRRGSNWRLRSWFITP